uniref:Putative methyltransferase n=1 Tax=viral metagenome TaxID=1070528 RepID=A0A6M3IE04_9ZZZZ
MTINVGKVAMIPTISIEIGERARQDLGNLEELEKSMKTSGLIQPLAVQEVNKNHFKLLAGERRYSVLLANGVSEIPVRIYPSDLSEIEMKIIEKAENFYRKDMEYWEYDNLVHEIHEMEQAIHGTANRGGAAGSGHKLKDTAEMFGITDASVSTAIKRAEAREVAPELFENCKTQSDANKVLKKIDETIIKQSIAEKAEREKSPNSNFAKLASCFICGDFFEGVKKIPDGVMHLVEIDPPYAIDLNKRKKSDGESFYQQSDYNEVDVQEYQKFLANTFQECYRVMADHSWLICWFAPEPWFEVVYQELNTAGFNTTRMVGIWPKPSAQSMQPQVRLANTYEMFFYAWKGQPALNKAGRGNEFRFPPIPPQQKTHPTERPVELMTEIYSTFAFPGSRVFIPFLGSGVGLVAAHRLNMSAIGFELSKNYRDSFLVKIHNGVEYLR